MKKELWTTLLAVGTALPLVLLFWPFAGWGEGMALALRVTPAGCSQLLLCRSKLHPIIKLLPAAAAGGLALWGIWLYFTSPAWSGATPGGLFADYISPVLGCVLAVGGRLLFAACRERTCGRNEM